MSAKTWKKEFYPKAPTKKMTFLEATEHSLRKWIGLRYTNRALHHINVSLAGNLENDKDVQFLSIDSSSCALCKVVDSNCENCPIFLLTKDTCDISRGNFHSAFGAWMDDVDPEPMILLLESVREFLLKYPDLGGKVGSEC